ncbi:hypothetical protein [Sphingomonas abietis]|uniref:Uncharacterized protein n=1 Tax=Sphingomonas abietis TaxID=3012344 RepID=A0ABY7NLJ9_9SPHN|nr:hypothetical protein [Sphingomonas abietis]WBO22388.1 hypothetical protein PBT88_19985 [Sphingomonas abietis]
MKLADVIFACALLSIPVAALADDAVTPVASPAIPATKDAKDPNRIICKTEDQIGSRIATTKVCLTAAQWRDRAFHAGQWAEHQETYNSQPNGR